VVEVIAVSRQYTVRDTAASSSRVLNLSTAKLEPSDQIHIPGTSTPITELLDRRLGAQQTLLYTVTQGQFTCMSHQQQYHEFLCLNLVYKLHNRMKNVITSCKGYWQVVVTSCKVLSQHLPGGTKSNFNRVCSPPDMI